MLTRTTELGRGPLNEGVIQQSSGIGPDASHEYGSSSAIFEHQRAEEELVDKGQPLNRN